jgi:hypothetical protein
VKFALSVLAATLVVAASTGCSEDKQAASSTTAASRSQTTSAADATATRPTPPEEQSRWAQQVDDACEAWQEKIDAASSPPPTDVASLQSWLEQTLPLLREELAAVEAVKPPAKADEARKRKLFLNALHKTERALTRYLSAIRASAPAKVRKALADAGAAGASARAYAVSLDVTQCGGYSSG